MNSLRLIDDESNEYPKIDGAFIEEMIVRNGSRKVIEYLQLFEKSTHLDESVKQIPREIIAVLNRGKFPDLGGYMTIY